MSGLRWGPEQERVIADLAEILRELNARIAEVMETGRSFDEALNTVVISTVIAQGLRFEMNLAHIARATDRMWQILGIAAHHGLPTEEGRAEIASLINAYAARDLAHVDADKLDEGAARLIREAQRQEEAYRQRIERERKEHNDG